MARQQQLIDNFTVMHKGGAVLFSKELSPLKGNPINELVRTVLLEVCGNACTASAHVPRD